MSAAVDKPRTAVRAVMVSFIVDNARGGCTTDVLRGVIVIMVELFVR